MGTKYSNDLVLDLFNLDDSEQMRSISPSRAYAYNCRACPARIHTTTRPLGAGDIAVLGGIRLTAAARAILDAAEMGVAPEQIERVVAQALRRGLVTAGQLEDGARGHGRCVSALLGGALRQAVP